MLVRAAHTSVSEETRLDGSTQTGYRWRRVCDMEAETRRLASYQGTASDVPQHIGSQRL
jgi:hypothetical protein